MLLDVDYYFRVEQGKPDRAIIRTWHKEGEAVSVREETDFYPYFYIRPSDGVDATKFAQWVASALLTSRVNVYRYTWVQRVITTSQKYVLKVECWSTGDVSRARDFLVQQGIGHVTDADIPYPERWLKDHDAEPLVDAKLRYMVIDIEVFKPPEDGISLPTPNKYPVGMVAVTWETEGGDQTVVLEGAERGILDALASLINNIDPDIIGTYNGNKFDWPYLLERCRLNGTKLLIGRNGEPLYATKHEIECPGRILVDLLPIIRRDFGEIKIQTLKNVCDELGLHSVEDRVMIEGAQIGRAWRETPDLVRQYAKDDSSTTMKLARLLIPKMIPLARIARQRLGSISHAQRGTQLETLLGVFAVRMGRIIPLRPIVTAQQTEPQFEGGFVMEAPAGVEEDLELVDFASAYPGVQLRYNIGPYSHCVDQACHAKNPGEEGYKEHWVSPTKDRFHQGEEDLVCGALRALVELRKPWREKAKKLHEGTPEWQEAYNWQDAIKKMANSIYGLGGWAASRWVNIAVARSIASRAAENIKEAIRFGKELFGVDIRYGDTDSCLIRRNSRVHEWLTHVNKELSASLEYKGHYAAALFIGRKKKYALLTDDGRVEVKGFETKRGDWCGLARETQGEVIDILLKKRDVRAAVKYVKAAVKRVQRGEVQLSDLIFWKRVKDPEEYKGIPPHVKAAMRELGDDVQELFDTKVPFVVFEAEEAQLTPEEIRAGKEAERTDRLMDRLRIADRLDGSMLSRIDKEYYVHKQVLSSALRVLELFQVDGAPVTEETILKNQVGLGAFG